jgi:hypothetical protein
LSLTSSIIIEPWLGRLEERGHLLIDQVISGRSLDRNEFNISAVILLIA